MLAIGNKPPQSPGFNVCLDKMRGDNGSFHQAASSRLVDTQNEPNFKQTNISNDKGSSLSVIKLGSVASGSNNPLGQTVERSQPQISESNHNSSHFMIAPGGPGSGSFNSGKIEHNMTSSPSPAYSSQQTFGAKKLKMN